MCGNFLRCDIHQSPDSLYTTPKIKSTKNNIFKKLHKKIGLRNNQKVPKIENDNDDTPSELRTVYSVPKKSNEQCPNCKKHTVQILDDGNKKCNSCFWST